jgi:hypothetical protein
MGASDELAPISLYMTTNCPTTPFVPKVSPYSGRETPFAPKVSPYSEALFCPKLLLESGYAILQENGGYIEL